MTSKVTARIPSVRGLPWIGSPRAILDHPGRYLLEGYRRHGPVFGFPLFGMRITAMIGAEANRFIMTGARKSFSHYEGYRIVRTVLGEGLLFQDGETHRRNRQLMTPAFHQHGVDSYFESMLDTVTTHLARWVGQGERPMLGRFQNLTFEIMARLILGVSGELEIERLRGLNEDLSRGSISFPRIAIPGTPYARGQRALREVRAYLRSVVRARRDEPGRDALGLLMAARDEQGQALSEHELVEQCVILMFAGHETTASMLTSALMALDRHPDCVERIAAEIEEVIGDEPLTPEHMPRLAYLDAVLKEVERMWPPVSICQRGVLEDVEHAGYLIPKGSLVSYSPWATHRIPELFADPDRFDPDRFLPPRREHRATPYALVGFGGGVRLCLGQAFAVLEMKLVLVELMRRHSWTLNAIEPDLCYVPTVHPRSGLPGTVRSRD